MPTPSAGILLDAWEEGRARSDPERGLLLLAAGLPEMSGEAMAALPIGRRDAALLSLREALFGIELKGLVTCPSCSERLELILRTGDLRARGEAGAARDVVIQDGAEVCFRLPDSRDLLALAGLTDAGALRDALLERCILSIAGESPAPIAALREETIAAIEDRMSEIDPQANVEIAVDCPSCSHHWGTSFDILDYLWGELEAWARRTLHEVHVLATQYGWSEDEILALSPSRRRTYLEMVSA
ncbi:MAG TPA: hypothetical protein VFP58_12170 [Candidatus Eisenbacteria bacterium]|nr:hypothetical protein [Candidatus Eisenbacteria bacterium]